MASDGTSNVHHLILVSRPRRMAAEAKKEGVRAIIRQMQVCFHVVSTALRVFKAQACRYTVFGTCLVPHKKLFYEAQHVTQVVWPKKGACVCLPVQMHSSGAETVMAFDDRDTNSESSPPDSLHPTLLCREHTELRNLVQQPKILSTTPCKRNKTGHAPSGKQALELRFRRRHTACSFCQRASAMLHLAVCKAPELDDSCIAK